MPDADVADLVSVGHSLFGDAWRRPMANALAPYNPKGRRAISACYVANMQTGRRRVPKWVRDALPRMLWEDIVQKTVLHRQIAGAPESKSLVGGDPRA